MRDDGIAATAAKLFYRRLNALIPSPGNCSRGCVARSKWHICEDISEQREYVPASFRVIRYVRPKFACSCCDQVAQAPAPSRPIERGVAGRGLLAQVLVSKFADHIPLYRHSVMYAREGVEFDRSLLANW